MPRTLHRFDMSINIRTVLSPRKESIFQNFEKPSKHYRSFSCRSRKYVKGHARVQEVRPSLPNPPCRENISVEMALQKLSSTQLMRCVPATVRGRRVEEMATHLATPQLTFHGASNRFVSSTVKHGFIDLDDMNPETVVWSTSSLIRP
jgi:hypothetical protein